MMRTAASLFFIFAIPGMSMPALQPPKHDLVTLTMTLDKSVYRRGDPIQVTLVLRAGPRGAYLPDYFSDFIDTCERGFAAILLIKDTGASAIQGLPGCGASVGHSGNDTPRTEFRNFVHLLPGETRVWKTNLSSAVDHPDGYEVAGEYLSYAYMIDEVGQLPEVHGTMVHGRISAERQKISVK